MNQPLWLAGGLTTAKRLLIENEYKEEVFEEDDDYVIITPDDNTYDKNSLILTHKP